MDVYKVQMYIQGNEEHAISLRKELAQTVYDEFELGSVFGVSVDLDVTTKETYVMALCMTELEDGSDKKQIAKILDALPDGVKYMPIEFHDNNTSAYGFVDSEYYQIHNYSPDFISGMVNAIIGDKNSESPDGIYTTPDGRKFYMGYFAE